MEQQGVELLKAIKSVRSFLSDVSQLLSTADALMAEKSWESDRGSYCLGGLSYTVGAGHKWMPREAGRSYRNKDEYPNVIAIISVLLDDDDNDYKLSEPVVSGSCFVFPEDISEKKLSLDYWNYSWFGWFKMNADGIPGKFSASAAKGRWSEVYDWEKVKIFGAPLVSVTNEALLKENIINPLINIIEDGC